MGTRWPFSWESQKHLTVTLSYYFFITIRVVNFDSDEKSDQIIDIFSANQISGFLQ
jgi:hypothetical protein